MPIFIYIRHAKKAYSNGKAPRGQPQHDPPITNSSVDLIKKTSSDLIENFGIPKKIIMSPYLRIYQTVNELIKQIPNTQLICDNIFYDLNIAEYLGNQRGKIDLSDQTCEVFNTTEFPQPGESMFQLKSRVSTHLKIMDICDNSNNTENKVTWIVTHGLIIKTIYDIVKSYSNCNKNNINQFYPSELEYLIIKYNLDNTIELIV